MLQRGTKVWRKSGGKSRFALRDYITMQVRPFRPRSVLGVYTSQPIVFNTILAQSAPNQKPRRSAEAFVALYCRGPFRRFSQPARIRVRPASPGQRSTQRP
jgi:hypothetical protein